MAQLAPITTLGTVLTTQPATTRGKQVKVPCKVKNLKAIQAITLVFTFNPIILKYVRLEFPNLWPDGPPAHNVVPVSATVSQLRIAWSSLKPFTLKTNQVLFYFVGKYMGRVAAEPSGTTDLIWQTKMMGGEMCEYAIPDPQVGARALVDEPSETYYINGKVGYK